ncbi:SGNH/GDSL hydrolase family protein [Jiulongibacter sp. NS-SX5]|uniref:SGNH/GDSL hydrolase family protein n=1 Tax=Jiulongibacter sp. NS-SX5 TaxID=3463854 RepID=UPI0040583D69
MLKYIIYSLLLTVGACQKKNTPTATSAPGGSNANEESALTYLALGDSYTIGESVEESLRWPVQLTDRLQGLGYDLGKPRIIATTGWTTNELTSALNASTVESDYDLVSLLIGVNNQYRGRNATEFRGEFRKLLEQAIGYAGGNKNNVFVVSIPDYGVTPFGQGRNPDKIGKEIDEFNAVKEEICKEYGISYYDITPISREAINDPSLVASDGLHPSGKMYTRWVELFASDVAKKLD